MVFITVDFFLLGGLGGGFVEAIVASRNFFAAGYDLDSKDGSGGKSSSSDGGADDDDDDDDTDDFLFRLWLSILFIFNQLLLTLSLPPPMAYSTMKIVDLLTVSLSLIQPRRPCGETST